jgi:hypothetical protein
MLNGIAPRRLRDAGGLLAAVAWLLTPGAPVAQGSATAGSVTIRVADTAGIRRTEFPVRARVELPQRGAADTAHVQLRLNGAAVPAQITVVTAWPDGSVRTADAAFNVTLAPGESRTYQLAYGADVSAAAAPRGLMITESPDAIQIGSVSFSRSGSPLIASATYVRSEFVGQFAGALNGLALIDRTGARHDLGVATQLKAELADRGPLLATLRYTGTLPLDGSATAPFTLTIDMPSSKSWIKATAEIRDPGGRLRDIEFATPLALGAFPWQWDIGTEHGSYGAFRAAADRVVYTEQSGATTAAGWKIETGPAADPRLIETSVPARGAAERTAPRWRWGHLQGANTAVAFALDRTDEAPGTYAVTLEGTGQAIYRFTPAAARPVHNLIVYQHFVSTPVAIGAATSPASMLQPPLVEVVR